MGQVNRKMEVVDVDEKPKPFALQSIEEIIGRPAEEFTQRNVPYFKPDTEHDSSFGKLGIILRRLAKK